jgi:LemA protein
VSKGDIKARTSRGGIIQAARRYFNGNVKDLNNLVEMFPSNLFARMFSFEPSEFFEIEDTRQREPVQVKAES